MSRSPKTLRAQILRLAATLLGGFAGDEATPIRVTIRRAGVRVQLRSRRGELAASPEPPPGTSPLERQILGAASAQPVPAKQLARKLRRSCTSYFRDALRRLVRAGLLRHTPDGYALPAS